MFDYCIRIAGNTGIAGNHVLSIHSIFDNYEAILYQFISTCNKGIPCAISERVIRHIQCERPMVHTSENVCFSYEIRVSVPQ